MHGWTYKIFVLIFVSASRLIPLYNLYKQYNYLDVIVVYDCFYIFHSSTAQMHAYTHIHARITPYHKCPFDIYVQLLSLNVPLNIPY